jgi:SAM-dependent methyltransferase
MTIQGRHAISRRLDRRLVRLAGGILLADGLLRIAGRVVAFRLPGIHTRLVGGAETALGLRLLDRAPIEPALLCRVVAPVYDLLSPIWRDWLYRDALRAFDAALGDACPRGGDVLDLGCGTGAVLERIRTLDIDFATYTGVDLSPAMLARAHAKLGHVPGSRFERLDVRVERLPDGPFDLVVSAWALEHLPEPGTLVAAARARLRPGGRLVLFFELDGHSAWAWALRRLWWFFSVRLVPEPEGRNWPGLVSLRRFPGLGPDVALAVVATEPLLAAGGRGAAVSGDGRPEVIAPWPSSTRGTTEGWYGTHPTGMSRFCSPAAA